MGFGLENHVRINARFAVAPLLVVMTACATTESAQPIAEFTKVSIPCPSQDFREFLQVFTESADVQRQFTSLPLEHGLLDLSALGSPEIVEVYTTGRGLGRVGSFLWL